MKLKFIVLFASTLLTSCKQNSETKVETTASAEPVEVAVNQKKDHQLREILKVEEIPAIDGVANDKAWENAEWQPLDQRWLGDAYTPEDFSGKYKLVWNEDALYLLVEIIDDKLYDQHSEPLKLWWDDDCVEIFIDEDNSGGEHLKNHNAFAYHVALDHNVVDMSTEGKGILFNDHVTTAHKTEENKTTWEHKILIFDDSYNEKGKNNPVKLTEGKKIGFALAYCDNDNSKERENFIGSVFVPGEDKNQGYKTADIFGTVVLK